MASPMLWITFGQDNVENVLAGLSPDEIDNLTFGAIQLDATGKVLSFNAVESSITGLAPKDVIGRNFFNDVAPCCNKPAFRGVFNEGVRTGNLNIIFDYVFDYRMNPTMVTIHLKASKTDDTYWVLVKRL